MDHRGLRLLPAHTLEAKQMAARVCEELIQAPDSEAYDRIRELLADAMGWGSWNELCEACSQPHEPIYLDDHIELIGPVATKLSHGLGFDYAHAAVFDALTNSGFGLTPKLRRVCEDDATPWGVVVDGGREVIAEGIERVETASHGGYILSPERQEQMPPHLALDARFYEEDCEAVLVELAFPQYFKDRLPYALAHTHIGIIESGTVPRERNLSPKHEAMLADILSGPTLEGVLEGMSYLRSEEPKSPRYIQPDQDPMNRPLTDQEQAVIDYLGRCVAENRRPVVEPDTGAVPSLQDWLEYLSGAITVDGRWPLRNEMWKVHFLRAD